MPEAAGTPAAAGVPATADQEQHASWLELFFDLIFVVVIAQLGELLRNDRTAGGVLRFVVLFVPLWWAWIGATFYTDRFGVDDPAHRGLTALQMLGVAILAVTLHHLGDGFDRNSGVFAVSYAAVRFILVAQYLRAGRRYPGATALTRRYAGGFAIAALVWVVSALVPPPGRYGLWALALVIDFATPLTSRRLHATFPLSTSHLPERFGLFTLIVLGEAILAVVHGIADQRWGFATAATASLGLAIAFSLWWVYFDDIDTSVIRRTRLAGQVWVYTHLPLVMGLTAASVGMEGAVTSPSHHILSGPDRWMLAGPLVVCLLALSVLDMSSRLTLRAACRETLALARMGGAGVILLVAALGLGLRPLPFVAVMAALCWAQVVVDTGIGRRIRAARARGPARAGS